MKKLTSKLFAIATICTMLFMAAACSSDAQPDTDVTGTPTSPANSGADLTDTPSKDNKDVKTDDADSSNDADTIADNNADSNAADDSTDNTPDTTETVNGLPKAFTTITRTSIPDILYSWWNIVCVEKDGVKDDFYSQTAQYQSVMEGYGELFDLIFSSETEVTLQTGENGFTISSGTYTVAGDNMLHIVFDNSEYYAVFTTMAFERMGSKETMVLVNTAAPDITLYLWHMDEI